MRLTLLVARSLDNVLNTKSAPAPEQDPSRTYALVETLAAARIRSDDLGIHALEHSSRFPSNVSVSLRPVSVERPENTV